MALLIRLVRLFNESPLLLGLVASICGHLLFGAGLLFWSGNTTALPGVTIEVVLLQGAEPLPARTSAPLAPSVRRSPAARTAAIAAPVVDTGKSVPISLSPPAEAVSAPAPATQDHELAGATPLADGRVEHPSSGTAAGSGTETGGQQVSEGSPVTPAGPPPGGLEKPVYPKVARQQGWQGTVKLRVYVFADGRVGEVFIEESSGHEVLDASATKTARRARFTPARIGSQTVDGEVRYSVKFMLD